MKRAYLVSKGLNPLNLDPWHHSWIWKNITENQYSPLHQGHWLIGNGNQIPLSHPDWFQCSNQVLREHRLDNGTVAELVDSQTKSWKCDLVRKIYQPPIAKEILQIPLPKTQGNNDKLIWKHSHLEITKLIRLIT